MMTVLGFLTTSAYVGAERATGSARMERSADKVVGASIAHPEGWTLEHEGYTFGKTYGFTMWRQGDAADEDGGMPAVRVALAYDLSGRR